MLIDISRSTVLSEQVTDKPDHANTILASGNHMFIMQAVAKEKRRSSII